MSITEKYELTLNNHTVQVIHKGFKYRLFTKIKISCPKFLRQLKLQ